MKPTLALAIALVAAAPLGGAAQTAGGTGMIAGTAYDSLRRMPLAGAEVQVRGMPRSTTSDSVGRFRFEALEPGTYTLELTHPFLDAAGIFVVTTQVIVAPDQTVPVRVAPPSLGTVWRRLCGRSMPYGGSDTAIVYGTVSDAGTGTRFAGAGVRASWRALQLAGPTDVSVRPLERTARTDSLGTYVICGATTDVTVRVRAFAGSDSSGAVEVAVASGPLVRRDLTIGRAIVRGAALRGVVRRADGVTPVPEAQIIVEEGRQRFADRSGGFLIDSLPAGTRWLVVRAVGFTPAAQAVDLRDGDTAAVRVTLEAAPFVLDTVRVVTRMSKEMAEFEERRKSGFGFVLTEEQIKHRSNMRSVFIGVPQMRVIGQSMREYTIVFTLPSGATCTPTIYIDGRMGALHELYGFVPTQIAGAEFYSRPSTIPLRFQNVMNPCGVVVLWTKTLQ